MTTKPTGRYANLSVIGCDEVGTGEVFRPQVFCACFVARKDIEFLKSLGIKDSKRMSRKKCCRIAQMIIPIVHYSCTILTNKKFNELCSIYDNQIDIECFYHNSAIEKLLSELEDENISFDKIIVDKYCEKDLFIKMVGNKTYLKKTKFMTHGEDEHIAVAAASVIATFYQEQLQQKILEEVGIDLFNPTPDLPTDVAKLNALVNKYGRVAMLNYAKMNHSVAAKYFVFKAARQYRS